MTAVFGFVDHRSASIYLKRRRAFKSSAKCLFSPESNLKISSGCKYVWRPRVSVRPRQPIRIQHASSCPSLTANWHKPCWVEELYYSSGVGGCEHWPYPESHPWPHLISFEGACKASPGPSMKNKPNIGKPLLRRLGSWMLLVGKLSETILHKQRPHFSTHRAPNDCVKRGPHASRASYHRRWENYFLLPYDEIVVITNQDCGSLRQVRKTVEEVSCCFALPYRQLWGWEYQWREYKRGY